MSLAFCPLTKSSDLVVVDKIATNKIVKSYQQLGIDVTKYFLNQDYIYKYKSKRSKFVFYYPFSVEGDELLYAQLGKKNWYYTDDKWEHNCAVDIIEYGEAVLEVGCGNGSFLKAIRRKKDAKVVGLELNSATLASLHSEKIESYNSTISEYLLSSPKEFNVVCMFQVLEHISQVNSFLNDCLDVLKPKGKLIISVPNNDSFIKYDKENILNMPPHHMGLWNKKSLLELEKIYPLKVVNFFIEPLQGYHEKWYYSIFVKRFFGAFLYYRCFKNKMIQAFLLSLIRKFKKRIKGHSLLVVYEKL